MRKYMQIYNYYLEEDEEKLISDLVPGYYIEQNIDKNKVGVGYAIRFLQNNLNYLLGSFVNGGFSYRGFILYPFVKDISKENIRKIKRLKKIAIFLNNNGYDFSNCIKKYKDNINSNTFASILSALYQDYSSIKTKKTTKIKKPKCKELNLSAYKKIDLDYLCPLNELKDFANRELKQYLLGFYLHGSLATKDYVKGWSDVDTLGIISKKTISNPNALLNLRNKFYYMRHFFYKIDPLQHHGSTVISEYDLENYCQAYFPTTIFKYAKSFFKDDKVIKFNARDFSSEALKSLFWQVSYFRKLNEKTSFNLGGYETKTLLHYVTLFPAIYLQAKGKPMYKKFAFDIAEKDFKKEEWQVIDNVSSIRKNWNSIGVFPLINLFSKVNPLLCYQLNSRMTDLFKNAKKDNRIDMKYITRNMHGLSEEGWSKIKNENRI